MNKVRRSAGMSPSSFQRNVGSRADVSERISVRWYAFACTYIRNPVLRDLGMDIHIHAYTSPCVYLDGDVAVSLDSSRKNESRKLGTKGYISGTWKLGDCENVGSIRERGKGTRREAGNEKSGRIGRKEIPQQWWNAENFLCIKLPSFIYLCKTLATLR